MIGQKSVHTFDLWTRLQSRINKKPVYARPLNMRFDSREVTKEKGCPATIRMDLTKRHLYEASGLMGLLVPLSLLNNDDSNEMWNFRGKLSLSGCIMMIYVVFTLTEKLYELLINRSSISSAIKRFSLSFVKELVFDLSIYGILRLVKIKRKDLIELHLILLPDMIVAGNWVQLCQNPPSHKGRVHLKILPEQTILHTTILNLLTCMIVVTNVRYFMSTLYFHLNLYQAQPDRFHGLLSMHIIASALLVKFSKGGKVKRIAAGSTPEFDVNSEEFGFGVKISKKVNHWMSSIGFKKSVEGSKTDKWPISITNLTESQVDFKILKPIDLKSLTIEVNGFDWKYFSIDHKSLMVMGLTPDTNFEIVIGSNGMAINDFVVKTKESTNFNDDNLQRLKSSASQLMMDINYARTKLKKLKHDEGKKIAELESSNESLRSRNYDIKEMQSERTVGKMKSLKHSISHLEAQIEDLEEQQRDLAEMKELIAEQYQTYELRSRLKIQRLEEEYIQLENQLKEYESKSQASKDELSMLESKLNKLQLKQSSRLYEIAKLEDQIHTIKLQYIPPSGKHPSDPSPN